MYALVAVVVIWLVAPIVLGIALIVSRANSRRRFKDLEQFIQTQLEPECSPNSPAVVGKWFGDFNVDDVKSLLVLDVDLERQRKSGELPSGQYAEIRAGWDFMWSQQLRAAGLEPDTDEWHKRRDAAWEIYLLHQHHSARVAPWRREAGQSVTVAIAAVEAPATPFEEAQAVAEDDDLVCDLDVIQESNPALAPSPSEPPALILEALLAEQVDAKPDEQRSVDAGREQPLPVSPNALPPTSPSLPGEEKFALTPVEPSLIERVVETISGWPKLVAPFLVQNIGWFIGAFCFIAGTVFLVSYTTGFANALAVLSSLAVYTALLLWAGYQIRKRRPDLRVSSDVLLAIGMLLCPLNLAAAARLIDLAIGTTGAFVIALLAAAGITIGAYFAAILAGGLMDRSLSRRHAQVFVALAVVQLLVPWVGQLSHWAGLAGTHLLLLALLGYGLFAFSNDWMRSLVVDRRQIAYYAAGLLVFAGVASFAHLTWSFSGTLPQGYAAPFLMALGGLLFFVDAALKAYVQKHVVLSRFTFALYGISVVALLLSWQTALPQLLTLVLGAFIYAFVLLRYLTPPPLYLLLVCLGWLYSSVVLDAVATQWHLFASTPALGVLLWAGRRIVQRAPSLARIFISTFFTGFAALTGWTLLGSEPGWLAFSSAVAAAVFVRYAGRLSPPQSDWVDEHGDFPHWRYLVALLAGVSVVYVPPLLDELQLPLGLVALAGVGTLMVFRTGRVSPAALEAHSNSALIAIAAAIALSVIAIIDQAYSTVSLVSLYTLIGVVLIRLSIGFLARWLLYAGLIAVGASCVLVKTTYFAAGFFGLTEFLASIAVWTALWWLNRSLRMEAELGLQPALAESIQVRLLWTIPVQTTLPASHSR